MTDDAIILTALIIQFIIQICLWRVIVKIWVHIYYHRSKSPQD